VKGRILFFGFCLMLLLNIDAYSQAISLDEAIINAGKTIEQRLAKGTMVAVLNFNSESKALSKYVIEELINYFTNNNDLIVVENSKMDNIRDKIRIIISEDVSDESAQSAGRQLGASSIISGSFSSTGRDYRLRLYSISVDSAVREVSSSISVSRGDPDVHFLLTGTMLENTNKSQPVIQEPEAIEKKEYKIGDFGPAGGIVFFDKGSFSNGWRYLETAPVEIEFSAKWGLDRRDVKTNAATGTGKNNTQVITEELSKTMDKNTAAQLCAAINFDGFTDWFIPSKDELDLMYKNLKLKNIGGFGSGKYLSSTQRGRVTVWAQNFSNGRQEDLSKSETFNIRVIRSF